MEWGGIFVLKLRGNNAQNGGKKGRKLTAMALYTFVLLFLNLNEEEDHVAASNGLAQLSPLNFFLYLCLFFLFCLISLLILLASELAQNHTKQFQKNTHKQI